jgi:1,4-dihydroxy-6-naphthoate synthase
VIRLAFSPCPNDTYIFHAWTHGLIPGAPDTQVTFADVDVTNTAALDGSFDVVKVSYGALPWLLDKYRLLPCGGALGRGCGPLVLTRAKAVLSNSSGTPAAALSNSSGTPAAALSDLNGARVAVPGERTTAYLLMRLWALSAEQRPASIDVVPFDKIMPGVRDGQFDAGLVIHEARFTYPSYGLAAMVDLGQWWEQSTGNPIPLGAILAKRETFPTEQDAASIAGVIRASVDYANTHPGASAGFIAAHAQEMDQSVQRQHIALYVNEFSRDLGPHGYKAITELLERAQSARLVPATGDLYL